MYAALCATFPDAYWRELDRDRAYPEDFVKSPDRSRLPLRPDPDRIRRPRTRRHRGRASILDEVNRSGGNAAACHAQMYVMGALVRHGSDAQKERWLPPIARGELRFQAFSVTEREAGSDTTAIATTAERDGDGWVVNGHKNWTSRIEQSDLMLLLARTSPRETRPNAPAASASSWSTCARRGRRARSRPARSGRCSTTRPIEVTYRDLRLPADALVGEEASASATSSTAGTPSASCSRPKRSATATGSSTAPPPTPGSASSSTGRSAPTRASSSRSPAPIAAVTAADLVQLKAAWLFDRGERCGAEANMAKLLASEASWAAANACLDAHGGYGFVDDYDVERKFRETRLFQIAPVSNNLVLAFLATHVLGLAAELLSLGVSRESFSPSQSGSEPDDHRPHRKARIPRMDTGWQGRCLEDFTVGAVYEHRAGADDHHDRQHLVHAADDEHQPDPPRPRLRRRGPSSAGPWSTAP